MNEAITVTRPRSSARSRPVGNSTKLGCTKLAASSNITLPEEARPCAIASCAVRVVIRRGVLARVLAARRRSRKRSLRGRARSRRYGRSDGVMRGDGDDRLDDARIPLRTRVFAEDGDCTFVSHALSVLAGVGHRVVRVAHCDDACLEGDLLSGELVWVAVAVGPFMVRPYDGRDGDEVRNGAEQLVADDGVALNFGVFVVGESARLGEHVVVDAEFADVV